MVENPVQNERTAYRLIFPGKIARNLLVTGSVKTKNLLGPAGLMIFEKMSISVVPVALS